MSAITTHVLDTALGRPAAGVPVKLEKAEGHGAWKLVGQGLTDAGGRLRNLLADSLEAGTYRLTFECATYFISHNVEAFYPLVTVIFAVRDPAQHYHVPLLLSPHGYTTYRGS